MTKRKQTNNSVLITPALLIAVSDSKEKDKIIKIVTNLIK